MGRNKFSGRTRGLEKIQKNNPTIALNILYGKRNKKKKNSKRKYQVILLMISNDTNDNILQ